MKKKKKSKKNKKSSKFKISKKFKINKKLIKTKKFKSSRKLKKEIKKKNPKKKQKKIKKVITYYNTYNDSVETISLIITECIFSTFFNNTFFSSIIKIFSTVCIKLSNLNISLINVPV